MGFAQAPYVAFDSGTLLVLLIIYGFMIGFAFMAYFASNLVTRLVKKRKILVRIVSWTILIPLFLSLALTSFFFMWSFDSSSTTVLDFFMIFSDMSFLEFTVFPINGYLLIIWVVGVFVMINSHRKEMLKEKANVEPTGSAK